MKLTLLFCCLVYLTQELLWRLFFARKTNDLVSIDTYRRYALRILLLGITIIQIYLLHRKMLHGASGLVLLSGLLVFVFLTYKIKPRLPHRIQQSLAVIFTIVTFAYAWFELSHALPVALFNPENCPPPPPEGSKFSNITVGVSPTFWTKLFGKFPICP